MSYQILVLSDLHLGEMANDARYPTFLKILEKFRLSAIDELFLMGDIFDILVGNKSFWKKVHPEFFTALQNLQACGKKVTWVQGNHDFQLAGLLCPYGVNWIADHAVVKREAVQIYLSHGDLADTTDKLHPLWRAFLTSRFLAFFISLIPSSFAENTLYPLTRKISRASRKASLRPDRVAQAKTRFREYAQRLQQKYGCDLVLLGHSHINDDHALGAQARYCNFGSWYQEAQLGLIDIHASSFSVKLSRASTWLADASK